MTKRIFRTKRLPTLLLFIISVLIIVIFIGCQEQLNKHTDKKLIPAKVTRVVDGVSP